MCVCVCVCVCVCLELISKSCLYNESVNFFFLSLSLRMGVMGVGDDTYALHYCASYGSLKGIEILLENGKFLHNFFPHD